MLMDLPYTLIQFWLQKTHRDTDIGILTINQSEKAHFNAIITR